MEVKCASCGDRRAVDVVDAHDCHRCAYRLFLCKMKFSLISCINQRDRARCPACALHWTHCKHDHEKYECPHGDCDYERPQCGHGNDATTCTHAACQEGGHWVP